MDNSPKSPEEYAHGWRRVSTVYPTDLDGDQEAIEEWRKKTIELLEQLEAARVAAGGKTPQEHLQEASINASRELHQVAQQNDEMTG